MSYRNSRTLRGGTPAQSLEQSTGGCVESPALATADRNADRVALEPLLEAAGTE